MGVELHGVAHDIGDLVEAPVVEELHGVEYATLHGLEAVVDVGDGSLENHIARIVEKPALIHAAQLMAHGRIGCVDEDSGVEITIGKSGFFCVLISVFFGVFDIVSVVFVAHNRKDTIFFLFLQITKII